MNIAVLGAGAIGSTFASQLAKAGHTVSVVARSARLAQLERDRAIVMISGEKQAVSVHAALDEGVAYDLVLVTVLAPQVDAVLPALRASAAKSVMFMFNTFASIAPLRDAVGADRFVFGFPGGVFTLLVDGKIRPQIRAGTTVGDERWAKVFSDAEIPTVVDADMQSWLRSHAALVAPLMSIGVTVASRGAGIAWAEARTFAVAMRQAFGVVQSLGNALTPSMVATLSRLPLFLVTAVLWALSRTTMLRELGQLGPAEARMLIDMMTAAAPDRTAQLVAIRP